jgi:hypothetical protein
MGTVRRKRGELVSVELDTEHVSDDEAAAFLQLNRRLGMHVEGKPKRGLLPDIDHEADRAHGEQGTAARIENLIRDGGEDPADRDARIRDTYKRMLAENFFARPQLVGIIAKRERVSASTVYRALRPLR